MAQIRQIILGAALSVTLLLAAPPAAAQEGPPDGTDIVYLNVADVIQSQPEFAEMTRAFDQEIADSRTELQEEAAEVDSLIQEYQQQESVLSPQAKEQMQQEIRSRQQELVSRQQEMNTQLGTRQQELLAPILEQVGDVIEQVRMERNYSMVLDISSEGVVAADPALDITGLVMSRVDGGADTAASQP